MNLTYVIFACDRAVEIQPENEQFRDSRSLARGLTNNFKGTFEEFKVFIQETKNTEQKAQRQL